MLAFITTLRHPQNAADYGRVEALLQDTLASLVQQTCDDYLVIIVGNRRPSFPLPERVRFVEVDFPPPSPIKGPRTGPASVIWDKGTKNAVGLLAARDFTPDYVMFVDADDFVHRELAAFVHARPGHAGWVVKRGLMYSRRRNAYKRLRNFYRFCGTSFVIPFDAYDVPSHLTVSSSQQEIAAAFGERLEHVLEHGWAFDWWRNHGRILEPLPFPGAVYQVENRENHSENALFGPARPYRSQLLRDFAIHPSKSPASTLWSSFGPAALRPDLRLPRPAFMQPKSYLEDFKPPGDSVVRTP
ncbi:glycosyltransferase family A protein [Mycobacterium sp.]|uniref:glycosyltransferase family A protein n=1 Tax=Mycobacterium sp. TaxID=1785 RepID=UPI003F95C6A9